MGRMRSEEEEGRRREFERTRGRDDEKRST